MPHLCGFHGGRVPSLVFAFPFRIATSVPSAVADGRDLTAESTPIRYLHPNNANIARCRGPRRRTVLTGTSYEPILEHKLSGFVISAEQSNARTDSRSRNIRAARRYTAIGYIRLRGCVRHLYTAAPWLNFVAVPRAVLIAIRAEENEGSWFRTSGRE
jgi:hypothetical protein